ncbi:acyl-ACP--UDP-N-acetylglucosamine O-acyltransferase [Puniceicoccus vermicola]|uniref:Acyl-ACP--UDP-N-acetylglucosamine O-acyltransferase n=1 Tax=Puniceicoccus vermicola TaxID=388746 RepID=A0A7X1E6W5_9BACT|nr:acyl-ACP--UDP-N-acetylglucosamine O-acyltransferase [Puniceicoccus vermicola]MBC2603067.1 acyl-ACP--UDP-N-acetylglucosamine O-acyltransferase [Puniceicoccus vermicola]
MPTIHPTAVIEDGAQISDSAEIGAYAYIGGEVRLGPGCRVYHHATVEGYTEMGRDNEVFPYAMIGGKTHDLKFTGGHPGLKIGNSNVFREYSTVHLATKDEEFTVLGDNNTILAYSHIAHDCQIGNHLIMSSHAALGGHVICEDHVNVGWGAGIHQFCRLGSHSMVGASSKLVQDLAPFFIAEGGPAKARTHNRIGLERSGYSAEEISLVHQAFKILYREGLNRSQSLAKLEEHPSASEPILSKIISFYRQSTRGVC